MANKHRPASVIMAPTDWAQEQFLRAFNSPVVPKDVMVNFDRWCNAMTIGNVTAQARLQVALRRAGYAASVIDGISEHAVYRLRRLE